MRFSVGLLLTLALAAPAAPVAAQGSRFSVEPFYSYASPSAIYDKTVAFVEYLGVISIPPSQPTGTSVERLSMGAVQTVGVRAGYHLGPAWAVQLEASHGSSRYRYLARTTGIMLYSEETWEGSADLTSLLVRVGRTIVATGSTSVDALVIGGVQRLNVSKNPEYCLPPSLGTPACFAAEPWQGRYDVPSVGGGLAVTRGLGSRLSARSSATYSVGRANTSRFWTDLIPQYDQYEADRSHRVGVLQLTAGVAIGL